MSLFKALHQYRWSEEAAYKLLKCRPELEKFSGKTARAVCQDFYAKVWETVIFAKLALACAVSTGAIAKSGFLVSNPVTAAGGVALATASTQKFV